MTPRELYIVVRNVVRVLADSERSQDILEAEEIVCRGAFRRLARQLGRDPAGRMLLRERPELSSRHVDYDGLRRLTPGTLGREYAHHLDHHGLDPDMLWAPLPIADEPADRWLLRRYRGGHDIWHVLLGLGTEGYEEVLVHAFSLGQLNLPVSQMICLLGTPKHIVLEGRLEVLRHQLWQTFWAGRRAAPLLQVRWEDRWEQPLAEVREQLGITCPARGGPARSR